MRMPEKGAPREEWDRYYDSDNDCCEGEGCESCNADYYQCPTCYNDYTINCGSGCAACDKLYDLYLKKYD